MHLHYLNVHAFPFDVKIASHENVYVYLLTWWLLSILLQWDERQKYHTVETILKIPHCRNNSKNTTLSKQF
jgi:hypothetical protein